MTIVTARHLTTTYNFPTSKHYSFLIIYSVSHKAGKVFCTIWLKVGNQYFKRQRFHHTHSDNFPNHFCGYTHIIQGPSFIIYHIEIHM